MDIIMSNKKSHKSVTNVPCDILFFILTRLPVKSLLRFRSCSRPWNDIISDKEFKKAQSDQFKILGCVNILLQKYHGDKFKVMKLENQQIIAREEQRLPLKGSFRTLCSHDGLVLLTNGSYNTFALWNPSTRQCQKIASGSYLTTYRCGLCYDPTIDDYKVILIYESFYRVYYSARNSWKKKTTPLQIYNTWSSLVCEGITIEGHVYWSMQRGNSKIIYFDVKADELKELPTPSCIDDDKVYFSLIALKGRLCLYTLCSNNLWIMEEDGSKLLMKLPKVLSEFGRGSCFLCYMKNDEIIFYDPENLHIFIYNLKEQKVVKNFTIDYDVAYKYAHIYPMGLDSLHFPKVMH